MTMDPRVKSGAVGLQQQFALSKRLYDADRVDSGNLPRLNDARDRATAAGNTELARRARGLLGAGGGSWGGRGGGCRRAKR